MGVFKGVKTVDALHVMPLGGSKHMEYIKIQDLVRKYSPMLYDFVSLSQSKWDKINARSNRRLEHIEKHINLNNEISREVTLFDIYIQIKQGSDIATGYIKFLENIIIDVKKTLPKKFLPKLRKRAYDIIGNFDETRSNYRDTIGEFIAVITILNNSQYTLEDIEQELPNRKRVDYTFINQHEKKRFLIDVLNIDFKAGRIQSENDLEIFLTKRIVDKLKHKLENLERNKLPFYFSLLPVVWCELDEIENMNFVFKKVQIKYALLPFCTISQTKNINGKMKFIFTTVDKTLNMVK